MNKSIAALHCSLCVSGIIMLGATSSVGATAPKSGAITGTVTECGPGPIVAAPPAPPPVPKPASVIVMHGGRAYARHAIKFPKALPWYGSFVFTVPPGRYEVIYTYHSRSRWVNVASGAHVTVTFAPIACPL